MTLKSYRTFLIVLAVMILGLMALGAGVRTMNAGLSCPDWPLCFGKVIPDFHPAVWFEFVHRAYAGVVALLYAAALVIAFRRKDLSQISRKSLRLAAGWGTLFLSAQIIMGGLTVLMLVKAVIVTTHLLLATLFLGAVLWMYFVVDRELSSQAASETKTSLKSETWVPGWPVVILPILVFSQIAIGGLVASTYAGSVCVDWPLCNGKWVPTWKGAIGLQVIHRFVAYALVALFVGLAVWAVTAARAGAKTVLPARVRGLFLFAGVIVILQTVVGILNLLFYIPPHITVPHQTLAMILLGITLRLWFEARSARLLGAVELVGGGVSDKASRAQAGLQASEAGGGQTSVDVVLS